LWVVQETKLMGNAWPYFCSISCLGLQILLGWKYSKHIYFTISEWEQVVNFIVPPWLYLYTVGFETLLVCFNNGLFPCSQVTKYVPWPIWPKDLMFFVSIGKSSCFCCWYPAVRLWFHIRNILYKFWIKFNELVSLI